MTGEGKERLLIKHLLGRLLFDSSQAAGASFTLEQTEERWVITVTGIAPAVAAEVKRQLSDLNLFRFEEKPDGTVRKWWLYDKQLPRLEYEDGSTKLVLCVDSCVPYSNDSAIFRG